MILVKSGNNKIFVKYAGAKTINSNKSTDEAIQRLKGTVQIYNDLHHPTLLNLVDSFETEKGFVTIFNWSTCEGVYVARKHINRPEYSHAKVPRVRYKNLEFKHKIKSYIDIMEFHARIAEKEYVAIDFYDGSIMYDFISHTTKICDIEFYSKMLYINEIGRMWGSSRFMSPEEFDLGAAIDEVSNVFTMGALAFFIFGNEYNRSFEDWNASRILFDIATRAVSVNRENRYQSIGELTDEVKNTI